MTKRSTFQVEGIYHPQSQRTQIEGLKDTTAGVTAVEINLQSKIVTFVHDQAVIINMLEDKLKALSLTPSLTSTAEYP